jgi:hypothetical protein
MHVVTAKPQHTLCDLLQVKFSDMIFTFIFKNMKPESESLSGFLVS